MSRRPSSSFLQIPVCSASYTPLRAEKSLLLPFLLSNNRTDDLGVSVALFGRKALQPFLQTFTTAPAKHCDLCLKRLLSLPQTSVSFALNACPLCLKRLREKAPSLRIPFLPCSPHRAEGRRYHNSRPRGGRAEHFCPMIMPACPTSVFPARTRNKLLQKKRLAQMASFLSENE